MAFMWFKQRGDSMIKQWMVTSVCVACFDYLVFEILSVVPTQKELNKRILKYVATDQFDVILDESHIIYVSSLCFF